MTFETGLSSSRQSTPTHPTPVPKPITIPSAESDLARQILSREEPGIERTHRITADSLTADPSKTEPRVTQTALSQIPKPKATGGLDISYSDKGNLALQFSLLKSPPRSPSRPPQINSTAALGIRALTSPARASRPSSEVEQSKKALQRAWKGSSSGTSESGGYIKTELAISTWQDYLKKENLWDTRLEKSWEQFKELANVRRQMLQLSKHDPFYKEKAAQLAQKIQIAIYNIGFDEPLLLPGGNSKHLIVFELFCTPLQGENNLNMRLHDKSSYLKLVTRSGCLEQTLQTFDLPTLDFNKDEEISEFINALVKSWFLPQEDLKKIWQEPLSSQLSDLDSIPEFQWGWPQAAEDCTLASTAAFLRSWYNQNNQENARAIDSLFK